jgi:hypothetical protein
LATLAHDPASAGFFVAGALRTSIETGAESHRAPAGVGSALSKNGMTAMNVMLLRGGQLAGVIGALLMVVAVLARLSGVTSLRGFEPATLLLAGIGAVSVACFLILWSLAEKARR